MKKNLLIPFAALLLTSCGAKTSESAYSVDIQLSADENGKLAYLINYDDGEKIDSAVVANGQVRFEGTIAQPIVGRVVIDGRRGPMFVVEPGNVVVDSLGTASGTALNASLEGYSAKVTALQAELMAAPDSLREAESERLELRYNAMTDSTISANSGNVVGYYLFSQNLYGKTLAEIEESLKSFPAFADGVRVKKALENAKIQEATGPGSKYVDFEVTNDSGTQRLSDFAGKGRYLLVDFWASWCGPCIRETAVIKDLYNKYSDKGLDVLGVAVWDEPANTLAAIERHQLPWPQIINAQTIPTDLYGIQGIPCIILIDPEGTIVSRGKQGDELVADVDAAMASYVAPSN